ncbi:dihydrodipicolinate synthase family protein [Streptomyces sp. ISL-43]|uniref:dihydrodipicolinate synthase family protein n=1 Tax=Streptomyces sp. ISL-43 TaxID=2819183 RepID=UPI002035124D|nr:dihydrodipicolinate synthase family protein [Streptomyces sp. ISL-43]
MTTALVTPIDGAGEVDEKSTARLIASVRPYADALLPALSTGEGSSLSDRQWRDVLAAVVRHADGVPVLAGILRPTTAEAVARARTASGLGAAAVVVTTPYGPDVTQEEMYLHFEAVAGAGLPVVAYHESALSRNSLDLDTLLRVCALPGVAGVKDSAGDTDFTRALIAAGPGVPVVQGLEHLLLESGPVDGWVVALANIEPKLCKALLTDRGEERAAQLHAACERYGLERDDWYRSLKTELLRRAVIETDREVPC